MPGYMPGAGGAGRGRRRSDIKIKNAWHRKTHSKHPLDEGMNE